MGYFVFLLFPKTFNLRTDPFEIADISSNTYYDWLMDHGYISYAEQFRVALFIEIFQEFPPRMKPASFTVDQIMVKMEEGFRSNYFSRKS